MSEVWLFPAQPNMQVMVGWSQVRGKFYVEIEVYSTSLESPDKKTLIDMGYITHKDLTLALETASTYAKVPDDLYAFLSDAAKKDGQLLGQLNLPLNGASQHEAKEVV